MSNASPSSSPSASDTARAWLRLRTTAGFTNRAGRSGRGAGSEAGAATRRTRFGKLPVGLASSSSNARFCSRILRRDRGRTKPLRGGSDAVRMPTTSVHGDANGARLAVGRSGVLSNLGYLGGDQVTVGEGAGEFEVQLRKAQRQTLARGPAAGRGPDSK